MSYGNIFGHVSSESAGGWSSVLHNMSKKTVIWLDIVYMISLFEVTAKNLCHKMLVWHADCKAESV